MTPLKLATSEYQDLALVCFLRHQSDFSHLIPCLKPAYFGGIEATLTVEVMLKFHEAHGNFPGFTVLAQLVVDAEADLGTERCAETAGLNYVRRLEEIDTSDWKFVRNNFAQFAREEAIKIEMRKLVPFLQDHKEPPEGFAKPIERAMQVGKNVDDIGLSLYDDVEQVVRRVTSEEYGISTGFDLLDQIWKMGWKPGWLIVLLAPPKRLKTTAALNLALQMVKAGYDVLFYATELSQELAFMRALCNLTGLDMDQANDSPETFIEKANTAIKAVNGGALLFKSFPSKSTTIADIEAHAMMAIASSGTKPKAIFIDYAETVQPAPRGPKEADYRQQANIYVDARALAQKTGTVVIMPDRCNKDTVEQTVPNMTSFQGSFEKAGVVDVAIGLCATEDEYLSNSLRLFVFLNRHGPAFQHIQARVSPNTYRIELDRMITYTPEAPREKSQKRGKPTNFED